MAVRMKNGSRSLAGLWDWLVGEFFSAHPHVCFTPARGLTDTRVVWYHR